MLNKILQQIGHNPTKQTSKSYTYKSPFNPKERTASFFVFSNNTTGEFTNFKDYSSGLGGDIYKFLMEYYNIDFTEAKKRLSDDFSFNPQTSYSSSQSNQAPLETSKSYEIIKVQSLENQALKAYLNSRGIYSHFHLLNEIYYQMNNKKYFAIGFKNDSGGYEIRNKYFKGNLENKDITTVKSGVSSSADEGKNARLNIFEGFLDYMSYKELRPNSTSDYLILNSVSLIDRAIKHISRGNYKTIGLYLDNDYSGDLHGLELIERLPNLEITDFRNHYAKYADLNDYLIKKENIKIGYRLAKIGGEYILTLREKIKLQTKDLREIKSYIQNSKGRGK